MSDVCERTMVLLTPPTTLDPPERLTLTAATPEHTMEPALGEHTMEHC